MRTDAIFLRSTRRPAPTVVIHIALFSGGRILYRLKVVFDNGRVYYSNTVLLAPLNGSGPHLLTTIVQGGSLSMQAAASGRFQVGNMSGQVVASGNFQAGQANLFLPAMAAGTYWVRFSSDAGVALEKFVQP